MQRRSTASQKTTVLSLQLEDTCTFDIHLQVTNESDSTVHEWAPTTCRTRKPVLCSQVLPATQLLTKIIQQEFTRTVTAFPN